VISIAKTHACLEDCLRGFEEHPADSSFLHGYEAAVFRWKALIENGSVNAHSLAEIQVAQGCETHNCEYRAGFWAALNDVNVILYPMN
jgi:hypothetical protein